MAKALYRKYRPTKLSDVIGQEQVTQTLIKALEQKKISHAYLFIGPRGTGKTSVARILAHEINHFDYKLEDDYVDIVEIDGASNRKIEDIRDLREKVTIAPTKGKYKVYIIDEVHMLTREAFNALLKTLEEPPEHVVFIMATTDAHKVPVTITSRAQVYSFSLAAPDTMLEFLQSVAKAENIPVDEKALQIIARRGGGSFRDSLSLLGQIATLSDTQITEDVVVKALGLPDEEAVAELLAVYVTGDLGLVTEKLKELMLSGSKMEVLVEEMIRQILANPKPELIGLLAKLSEVKAPFIEAKLLVALCTGENMMPADANGSATPTNANGSASHNNAEIRAKKKTLTIKPTSKTNNSSADDEATDSKTSAKRPNEANESEVSADNDADNSSNSSAPLPRSSKISDENSASRASDMSDGNSASRASDMSDENSGTEDVLDENVGTEDTLNEGANIENQESAVRQTGEFSWENFLEAVRRKSSGTYAHLAKCSYDFKNGVLHIYPGSGFAQSLFSKKDRKDTLIAAAPGVKITIHDYGNSPANAKKDETLTKISDIMGGEVKNDGGNNPF